jgi:hypothetical protein
LPILESLTEQKQSLYQKSTLLGPLVDSVDFYDKIVEKSERTYKMPNFNYLTPTKAALFGLMVRFRDPKKRGI